MSDNMINSDLEGIAVIGMAGRFPNARTPFELWKNICNAEESITFFNEDQLDDSIDVDERNNPDYIRARGVFPDIDKLDARFFGLTPRQAQIMDPQHRIFMEICWEAFENAGYAADAYDGLVGVFAGTGINSYFTDNILPNPDVLESFGKHQAELLNAPDYLSTRISYKFNLKGPSISMYTGCSTSLVAVALACDSLMSYQSDMALAGGVFIPSPFNSGYLYHEGEMFSADGHTRPFDAKANGTVFSCGAATVMLKRLEDAVKDNDTIYAVIRGTAINNDGSDKMSFTAPSIKAQAQVVEMALANAGFDPETIRFMETHGTGTVLGDPIEIEALTRAFRTRTAKKSFCAIGSIKANIGHLDAAAGVAGLIKTALALYHKVLPPSINFNEPNPKIDFENGPFYVNTKLTPLKNGNCPLRAGVSSFGVGGTNVHMILEEALQVNSDASFRPWQILPVSAKTSTALDSATDNLARLFEQNKDVNPADAAFTLQTGRKHFNHRRIIICKDTPNAIETLKDPNSNNVISLSSDFVQRDLVFMFSGQGAQYVNMGRELYQSEPLFRKEIDFCAEFLNPILNADLREIIFPHDDKKASSDELLEKTHITQPSLFVFEYALSKLWMSYGLRPGILIGHSIGEYVAACLAEVFSLKEALHTVALRGRLIQKIPEGAMLAVFLTEEQLKAILPENLCIAVINSPFLCVVSGEHAAVDLFAQTLSKENIDHRRLKTSHAFHSSMMEPALAPFKAHLETIQLNPPKIPFISNVTGTEITDQQAISPDYWCDHLRSAVRFSDSLKLLMKTPNRVFLEVGPGNTLATIARQHPDLDDNSLVFSTTRHVNEEISDRRYLLKTAGQLWLNHFSLDWSMLHTNENRRHIGLPTYPFERTRYWISPVKRALPGTTAFAEPDLESKEALHPFETRGSESSSTTEADTIESVLQEMWKKLLGYSRIDIDDNYFELGGNSLMAVRLFVKIEDKYGKRLPLATLYEAPTIRQLAAILDSEAYSVSWNSLVPIQTQGHLKPFFCIHAEGGNVLEYQALSKLLGPDQPFYGLQAQGLDGNQIVDLSIEEMASNYIREIKTIQPEGPYYLGGYCLGGLVAFEMAQQLQKADEEVGFLAFISTSTPKHLTDFKPKMTFVHYLIYKFMDRMELEVNNLSFLSAKEKLNYIVNRGFRLFLSVRFLSESIIDRIFSLLRLKYKWHSRAYILQSSVNRSDDAYMSYKPKSLTNKIHLFRVSRKRRELVYDPLLGWEGLPEGGIEVFEVNGFHKNIMKEPNVKGVAAILKKLLKDKQKIKKAA